MDQASGKIGTSLESASHLIPGMTTQAPVNSLIRSTHRGGRVYTSRKPLSSGKTAVKTLAKPSTKSPETDYRGPDYFTQKMHSDLYRVVATYLNEHDWTNARAASTKLYVGFSDKPYSIPRELVTTSQFLFLRTLNWELQNPVIQKLKRDSQLRAKVDKWSPMAGQVLSMSGATASLVSLISKGAVQANPPLADCTFVSLSALVIMFGVLRSKDTFQDKLPRNEIVPKYAVGMSVASAITSTLMTLCQAPTLNSNLLFRGGAVFAGTLGSVRLTGRSSDFTDRNIALIGAAMGLGQSLQSSFLPQIPLVAEGIGIIACAGLPFALWSKESFKARKHQMLEVVTGAITSGLVARFIVNLINGNDAWVIPMLFIVGLGGAATFSHVINTASKWGERCFSRVSIKQTCLAFVKRVFDDLAKLFTCCCIRKLPSKITFMNRYRDLAKDEKIKLNVRKQISRPLPIKA